MSVADWQYQKHIKITVILHKCSYDFLKAWNQCKL